MTIAEECVAGVNNKTRYDIGIQHSAAFSNGCTCREHAFRNIYGNMWYVCTAHCHSSYTCLNILYKYIYIDKIHVHCILYKAQEALLRVTYEYGKMIIRIYINLSQKYIRQHKFSHSWNNKVALRRKGRETERKADSSCPRQSIRIRMCATECRNGS